MGLLLFNWCGYRLVVDWLQQNTEARIEAVIEGKTYDPDHLLEIAVATNLPYTSDWSEWERVSGSVEVSGLHYQYVERKMEKGNMLYRCLPNVEKQNLLAARDEFFQLVNNFNTQTDKQSSHTIVINNFIGDYDDAMANCLIAPAAFVVFANNVWPVFKSAISQSYASTPDQPPQC
jgi:hypothetical protein